MRSKFLAMTAAASLVLAVSAASAQDTPLASFGDFGLASNPISVGGANVIGDTYQIDCEQADGLCFDNSSVTDDPWAIGEAPTDGSGNDVQIRLCNDNKDPVSNNCVHTTQVNVITAEPFVGVFLEYTRAGCEPNEFNFDNNKLGRAFSSGDGSSATEEGEFFNVSYSLGMVTPKKTHTLLVTAPTSLPGGCTQGINVITGIGIDGTSLKGGG